MDTALTVTVLTVTIHHHHQCTATPTHAQALVRGFCQAQNPYSVTIGLAQTLNAARSHVRLTHAKPLVTSSWKAMLRRCAPIVLATMLNVVSPTTLATWFRQ